MRAHDHDDVEQDAESEDLDRAIALSLLDAEPQVAEENWQSWLVRFTKAPIGVELRVFEDRAVVHSVTPNSLAARCVLVKPRLKIRVIMRCV